MLQFNSMFAYVFATCIKAIGIFDLNMKSVITTFLLIIKLYKAAINVKACLPSLYVLKAQ